MDFLRRRRWGRLLKDCNYCVAAMALTASFKGSVIPKDLARLLDAYIANPCLKSAVSLIEFAPEFVVFFEESKPGGFHARQFRDALGPVREKDVPS